MLLQTPKLYGLYHLDNELAKNQAYQCLTDVETHKKTQAHFSEGPEIFIETQHDFRHRAQLHWRQDHL